MIDLIINGLTSSSGIIHYKLNKIASQMKTMSLVPYTNGKNITVIKNWFR